MPTYNTKICKVQRWLLTILMYACMYVLNDILINIGSGSNFKSWFPFPAKYCCYQKDPSLIGYSLNREVWKGNQLFRNILHNICFVNVFQLNFQHDCYWFIYHQLYKMVSKITSQAGIKFLNPKMVSSQCQSNYYTTDWIEFLKTGKTYRFLGLFHNAFVVEKFIDSSVLCVVPFQHESS